MDRDLVVRVLEFAAAHKKDINEFVNLLDERDVSRGKIVIEDRLICEIAEALIREKGISTIFDPQIVFDHEYIFVGFKVKKFMTISVSCAIEINNFIFNAKEHFMLCTYNLLGKTLKNIAIQDAIKNLGRSNDLLKKGIVINGNTIAISFDKLFENAEIPEWLTLKYIKSEEGRIVFEYTI